METEIKPQTILDGIMGRILAVYLFHHIYCK